MTRRSIVIAWRLTFGLLTLAAIGTQFVIQVQSGFSIVNFFSYFTNLSNLIATIVFLFGAFQLIAQRKPSATTNLIRAGSVVNMAVVGVVFSALLREADLGALLPWVNSVLHYIMPVAVVVEWLFQPPTIKLGMRQLLLCQLFPLCYLVYSVIRGAIVSWYAYPFLNPATVGGYAGVAVYVVGIVITFFVVGWLLFTLGNKLNKNAAAGLDMGRKSVPSVDKTP